MLSGDVRFGDNTDAVLEILKSLIFTAMQPGEKQKLLSEEYLDFLREIVAEVSEPALQARITDMISEKIRKSGEISSEESNPWVKFAGIFQDDPLFDDFVENMAAYRQELDAQIAAYDASLEENQSA